MLKVLVVKHANNLLGLKHVFHKKHVFPKVTGIPNRLDFI